MSTATPRISFDESGARTYRATERPSPSGSGSSPSTSAASHQPSTSRAGASSTMARAGSNDPDPVVAMEINDRYAQALRDEQRLDAKEGRSFGGNEKAPRPAADGPTSKASSGHRHQTSYSSSEMDLDKSDKSDFDWDLSDDSELDENEKEVKRLQKEREQEEEHGHHIKRAKRLRRLYLWFGMLARPLRTGIIMLLGSGICIMYVPQSC